MGTLVFQATLGGAVNIIGPNIANTINFTLPSADGTSGQTWTTNGSGVLSFGTLGIAGGGTGQITATAAFNALAPSQSGQSGKYLTTDGTNTSWGTNPLGTVTSVAATVPSFLSIAGSPITTSGTLAFTLSGTALPTTSGGTGLTSFTSGGVVYASSTSALATGSALTYNGTKLATTGYFNASGMGIFQGSLSTFDAASGGLYAYYSSGGVIASYSDNSGTLAQLISSGSVLLWRTGGTEKMRLDASGNLGINTSTPSYLLDVHKSSDGVISRFRRTGATINPALMISANETGNTVGFSTDYAGATSPAMTFTTQATERMRIDASGNLGLGVTPSAWSTASSTRAMQFPGGGTIWGQNFGGTNPSIQLACNAYLDSVGYKYFQTAPASQYQQNAGTHAWQTAASGTAGNAITFTQAMTLDASGNLLVGTTSALVSAAGRGNITINGTSSSVLAFGVSAATKAYIFSDGTNLNINNVPNGYITFDTNTLERVRIPAAGGLQSVGSISVGNATPTTSGAGITFPATQSASTDANTLDDYEEGTFTPVLNFAGGTTGITYTTQAGRYTKIGRIVSVSIYILLSSKGSSTGAAGISGLPFTAAPTGGGQNQSGSIGYYGSFSVLTGVPMIRADSGTTNLAFAQSGAASAGGVTDTNFTNTSVFTINITYDI